jgi:hypothetical protein
MFDIERLDRAARRTVVKLGSSLSQVKHRMPQHPLGITPQQIRQSPNAR